MRLAVQTRPVDLGNQRLENRRPGRNLRYLDASAVGIGDAVQFGAQPPRDGVALCGALFGRQQIHLEVRLVRLAAQVVMADQAVKVGRPRCARVDLIVLHLRLAAQVRAEGLRHARRLFEGCAIGHVDDDLELALVVEGQHLHQHRLQGHQQTSQQEKQRHYAEERPPIARGTQQGMHGPPVEAHQPTFLFRREGVGAGQVPASQQAQRGPRRNDERYNEGEEHRYRGADGNRPHVGAHQSAHEGHGQNRRDDCKGRENGRIPDFRHRLRGHIAERPSGVHRHAEVPHHVLDHDDRVVDQNADAENEREQRHAVQRVAHQIKHGQREPEGHRNRQQHDARFAPPEEQRDQDGHGDRRQKQVFQQRVRLVLRRCAVVPCRCDVQVGGKRDAFHLPHTRQRGVGDVGCVGAFALGDGDRDGRILFCRHACCMRLCCPEEHIILRLRGAINNPAGHIAQIHRVSAVRAQNDAFQILGIAEEIAGVDANLLVALGEFARLGASIGCLQPRYDVTRREAEGRQLRAVQHYAHGAWLAPDHRGLGNIGNLADRVLYFIG